MFEIVKSNLRSRLAKVFFGDVLENEIQKASKQALTHISYSRTEGILPDIDFEIFNQMYEQTSWVRAVVGVICKAVTARGYTVSPLKPGADPKNGELLREFFSNCNPNDTLIEILDDITRDEYVFGNAFLELVFGADGKPKELWNLDATTMRVKADDHGGIVGYVQIPRWTTVASGSGRVDFSPNEVIHFKLGTKGATLYGLSPLASLILPITVDKYAQIYNRSFFSNGAKIRGAFIMKDASPEQVERNREYLQARAKNPDAAHSDLVLEGQIEFKQIGVNQKDMEFLDLREFTRNEILAVYGVPPGKVSIIETGNIGAGSGDHQTQTFYEETILPFQMRLSEKITKHIIRQGFGISDWGFQFNRRSIDEKDQAEIFNIYLQNGVFTPEEVRGMVATRLPELQKSANGHELVKGKINPKDTIVGATRIIVELENRFSTSLKRLFSDFAGRIDEKIPTIVRRRLVPKIKKLGLQFKTETVSIHGIAYKQIQWPEAVKQLDDLEAILEIIDENKVAKLIERFSLEAARKGFAASARRNKVSDLDDIGLELEEFLKQNAINLGSQISRSLSDNLRQTLIEGLSQNETIQQLTSRIESRMDNFAIVDVRSSVDAEGNVIRDGHKRLVKRTTAAESIARTEANRAFNEGNLDLLTRAGYEKVVFLLASDACEECRAVAESEEGEKVGKMFSISEVSGLIPVHPNCRCTWITET